MCWHFGARTINQGINHHPQVTSSTYPRTAHRHRSLSLLREGSPPTPTITPHSTPKPARHASQSYGCVRHHRGIVVSMHNGTGLVLFSIRSWAPQPRVFPARDKQVCCSLLFGTPGDREQSRSNRHVSPEVGDMSSALAARAECADDAVQTPLQRLPLARVVHPEAAGVGAEGRAIVHADAVLQQQRSSAGSWRQPCRGVHP
jgi:hypothetical protein